MMDIWQSLFFYCCCCFFVVFFFLLLLLLLLLLFFHILTLYMLLVHKTKIRKRHFELLLFSYLKKKGFEIISKLSHKEILNLHSVSNAVF